MPITGSATSRRPETWERCLELLGQLPTMSSEERCAGIGILLRCGIPGIRKRTLAIAGAVVDDHEISAFLRNPADDILRNAGLEILERRGRRSSTLARRLLNDGDPDVVLQAVLALDHHGDPTSLDALRPCLKHENPNVVQAAIIAIGHLGNGRSSSELAPFLQRHPWLQLAAIQALGDLRSASSIPHLASLLKDQTVGPLVAESIARIGGSIAFETLIECWLDPRRHLDDATILPLLASVGECLETPPPITAGALASLAAALNHDESGVRSAAAASILCAGPSTFDAHALEILSATAEDGLELPGCLRQRPDLAPALLSTPGCARAWGLLLAASFPDAATSEQLARALASPLADNLTSSAAAALVARNDQCLADVAFDAYLAASTEHRRKLVEVLRSHTDAVRARLDRAPGLSTTDRIAVEAALGHPADDVAAAVTALPGAPRFDAVSHLWDRPDVLARLPWAEWIESDPAAASRCLAEAVSESRSTGLLPFLELALQVNPEPAILRAFAELGAAEGTPILIRFLDHDSPLIRVLVLDTLGSLAGHEARRILKKYAVDNGNRETRIALRALARCATADDLDFFRGLSTHSDPDVRLICVEAMERFPDPKNLHSLVACAADPDATVAGRAAEVLQLVGVLG